MAHLQVVSNREMYYGSGMLSIMSNPNVELDKMYATLPKLDCKGLCQESCGPIDMSIAERKRIPIQITAPGEALRMIFQDGADYNCDALDVEGRCSVYKVRPLICRLWGMTEQMKCPHGCVPEGGFLVDEEAAGLIRRSLDIGGYDQDLARKTGASPQE